MEIVIVSVDHAPDDLEAQTPVRGRLLRKIAGQNHRGQDCWLAELRTPLSWTKGGVTRTIRHLVLWARWEGISICPGATLPVGIAYVIDDSLLNSTSFEVATAEYVAIGMAKVSRTSLWSRVSMRLLGWLWLCYRGRGRSGPGPKHRRHEEIPTGQTKKAVGSNRGTQLAPAN